MPRWCPAETQAVPIQPRKCTQEQRASERDKGTELKKKPVLPERT